MGESHLKPEFPAPLSAGFHPMTVAAVRTLCVTGIKGSIRRSLIMDRLTEVIRKLSEAGIIGEIWLDGSFVTEKIDPDDVDTLLRISSDQYDSDVATRTIVDWASAAELKETHSCDAYKWIEYSAGHPLFPDSQDSRRYWTDFFGVCAVESQRE